jgi:hypothetical protein
MEEWIKLVAAAAVGEKKYFTAEEIARGLQRDVQEVHYWQTHRGLKATQMEDGTYGFTMKNLVSFMVSIGNVEFPGLPPEARPKGGG